jgi:glycosyltransferase involved in cell wall biosynthesis
MAKYNNALDEITVITGTKYDPNMVENFRADLALEGVRKATGLGYKVIVVDSGSSDRFLEDVEKSGAELHVDFSLNMCGQRNYAMQKAFENGRQVTAWTEPEKISYMESIVKTAEPILRGEADIVVPRRISLESYPSFQKNIEPIGNGFFEALTGLNRDMWFGPKTWGRESAHHFLDYDESYGQMWQSIFLPILDAIHEGKVVDEVKVDFTYPNQQKEIEEGGLAFYKKRIDQLQQITSALEQYWTEIRK